MLKQLAALRILLTFSILIRDMCRPDQLDIAVGRKQSEQLMNRLAWCPAAHAHWNRIQDEVGAKRQDSSWLRYTLLNLANRDADTFKATLINSYSYPSLTLADIE